MKKGYMCTRPYVKATSINLNSSKQSQKYMYEITPQVFEDSGVPKANHRAAASHRQTFSHNVVSSIPHHEQKY
jgi:hypothetical protein